MGIFRWKSIASPPCLSGCAFGNAKGKSKNWHLKECRSKAFSRCLPPKELPLQKLRTNCVYWLICELLTRLVGEAVNSVKSGIWSSDWSAVWSAAWSRASERWHTALDSALFQFSSSNLEILKQLEHFSSAAISVTSTRLLCAVLVGYKL